MTTDTDRTQRSDREGLAALGRDLRALHAILPGLAPLARTEGEAPRPR